MHVVTIEHPSSLRHDPGAGHPERADRLRAIRAALDAAPFADRVAAATPEPAPEAAVRAVHSDAHVDRVLAARGRAVAFDADTATSPDSVDAALHAAGGARLAADLALDDPATCPFVLMRPPGHHAERERPMGFCLFNNVAVAAAHAMARGVERVLIFDPDVHHGNGTQDIFYRDPRVMYMSIHQYPFYPGSGGLFEIGDGEGRGSTVNVPLPGGMDDAAYATVVRDLLPEAFARHRPQLVLMSAGFDAHKRDPLAGMRLTTDAFAWIFAPLMAAARDADVGVAYLLEGGYDLQGLSGSVAAVVGALIDDAFAEPPADLHDERAARIVGQVRDALGWQS